MKKDVYPNPRFISRYISILYTVARGSQHRFDSHVPALS
jgi:hypothetical protein